MKWGFKAHKALMKYGHHKEGLDVLGGLYFTWRDKLLLSRAC